MRFSSNFVCPCLFNKLSNKIRYKQNGYYTQLTAKGLAVANRCCSPRSFAAETIFIDLVIFAIFPVAEILIFTTANTQINNRLLNNELYSYIASQWPFHDAVPNSQQNGLISFLQ